MKKILVTGGSRGIGYFIAKKLVEADNEVIITGRDAKKLANASKEIKAAGFIVVNHPENINLPGDFDVLVNNAGVYHWSSIEKMPLDKLNEIIKVNLQTPIELCKLVVPYMKQNNWGRIVTIGSISGAVGESNASVYSASKAGMIGLTKALALELAEYGITVNIINPGWVKTDMTKEFINDEILETIPQKRYVEPEEIAELVNYLISEAARSITGQSINLCCGLSLG